MNNLLKFFVEKLMSSWNINFLKQQYIIIIGIEYVLKKNSYLKSGFKKTN